MTVEAIDHLTDEHINDLCALYQSEWWTKGRQLPDVKRMLQHTDLIVAFSDSESRRLVAFARVLTDYVYKALVFDVIVAASHRNQGLGRALMDAIVNHAALKAVRHIELYCLPDLMPFYQQWGFTDDLGALRFMRRAGSA
jgi:GNAT superfamily N-acetyltransferase